MVTRGNQWLGVAFAFAAFASPRIARADGPACGELGIRVDGELSPRWSDAVARACVELANVPGRDESARVRMAPIDRDLSIEVSLADGRFASRRLASPAALRPTLEALLVVPRLGPREPLPEPAPPKAVAADDASTSSNTTTTAWPRPEEDGALQPARGAEPSVGLELGGGVGGRVAAHGYLSLAPAGFAEIRVGSWLLGALIRWDLIGSKSAPRVDVFEMETVAAGLLVGHRSSVGFGTIDVGLSPRIAVETQTYENKGGEQSLSATDVRLGSFARLALGRSALRAIVELDADVSPSRMRRVVQLDPLLPALPAWSAGLSIGLLWGAQ